MDFIISRQISKLHGASAMASIAISGGGGAALGWLLKTPGASRTILEISVPYAYSALSKFLDIQLPHNVSFETATMMARTAYERASHIAPAGVQLVGLGSTSTIATDRDKKGEHKAFVSTCTEKNLTSYSVVFDKGLRNRSSEDEIVSKLIIRGLAESFGIDFDIPLGLEENEHLEVFVRSRKDLIESLLTSRVGAVTVRPNGDMVGDEVTKSGILSGSFDPLHQGHHELLSVAESILNNSIIYELSVTNVDKPDLGEMALRSRIAQFSGSATVVVTRTPTFAKKAAVFPGCTFIVGWDTARRLVDPKYYGGEERQMLEGLASIMERECRFLVAGRMVGDVFQTLSQIRIPDRFQHMFESIPEAKFRNDESSTRLRLGSRNK